MKPGTGSEVTRLLFAEYVVADVHCTSPVCTGTSFRLTSVPVLRSAPPLIVCVVKPVDGARFASSTRSFVVFRYIVNSSPRAPVEEVGVDATLGLGRHFGADVREPDDRRWTQP